MAIVYHFSLKLQNSLEHLSLTQIVISIWTHLSMWFNLYRAQWYQLLWCGSHFRIKLFQRKKIKCTLPVDLKGVFKGLWLACTWRTTTVVSLDLQQWWPGLAAKNPVKTYIKIPIRASHSCNITYFSALDLYVQYVPNTHSFATTWFSTSVLRHCLLTGLNRAYSAILKTKCGLFGWFFMLS